MSGLPPSREGNHSLSDSTKPVFAQSHTELSSSRQTSAPSTPTDISTTPIQRGEQEKQQGQEGESPPDTLVNGDGAPLDRTQSQTNQLGTKQIAVIMTALCLALFLAALDMTIVSTALPVMAAYFGASESGYSWMASSYLLANASCIPLWGKVSDIWGRRHVILLANFVFLVASLICALAINLPMMLAGRAIQGIGGGGIVVLTNISVSDLFSVRQRPMYYGIFGAIWAIAGALGPIIGGAFTTSVTWRWCFWLNLPVGGVSFVALFFFLRIESPKTPFMAGIRSIDWAGVFLIIGGTLMFLFGLEFGGIDYPWASPTVICLIIFGVVTWVVAMMNEWKLAKYPIIPLRLFNNWHNVCIFTVNFCHSFTFIAGNYYLPLYFQTVLQATPILSGVYVLPLCLSLSFTSIATGAIIKITGRYRELIVAGLIFMTLGYGLFINLQPYASWPRIIIFQIIAGIGVGPIFQSPLVGLQANIHPADVATATATFNFVRQASASMAVVLGTVVYQNILGKQTASLSGKVGSETAQELANSFSGSSKSLVASLEPEQRRAVLETFTYVLSRLWIFYTAVIGLALIVSFFIRPVTLSKAHTFAKTGLEEQERARQEILAAERAKKGNDGAAAEKGGA